MATEEDTGPGPRVEYADEVEDYWARFQEQYNTARSIIENRWTQMSTTNQRRLLNTVWQSSCDVRVSEMPQGHRPDLE